MPECSETDKSVPIYHAYNHHCTHKHAPLDIPAWFYYDFFVAALLTPTSWPMGKMRGGCTALLILRLLGFPTPGMPLSTPPRPLRIPARTESTAADFGWLTGADAQLYTMDKERNIPNPTRTGVRELPHAHECVAAACCSHGTFRSLTLAS